MVGCENGSGERSVQEVICESGERCEEEAERRKENKARRRMMVRHRNKR